MAAGTIQPAGPRVPSAAVGFCPGSWWDARGVTRYGRGHQARRSAHWQASPPRLRSPAAPPRARPQSRRRHSPRQAHRVASLGQQSWAWLVAV